MLPRPQQDRRQFLTQSSLGLASAAVFWNRPCLASTIGVGGQESDLKWFDVSKWGVEGKGWNDTDRYYDRLPAKAHGKVRDAVWNLSRHSAGMSTRFSTDATSIHVRYRLLTSRLEMPHMPATGVSGVDLYAQDDMDRDRWVSVAFPKSQDVRTVLASGLAAPSQSLRRFTAYLPLYNGTEKLEFGVPAGCEFKPIAPRTKGKIVFYGTSIMHGACASRPGMSITALVGRRLNRPVINLGFSGNGRLEMELAELLAELDADIYALDCLPNLNPEQVAKRSVPFVRFLREKRPQAEIVMVEDRNYADSWIRTERRIRNSGNQKAFRAAFEELKMAGIGRLHYLRASELLGDDHEATTDGSHPNDLGMMRYADAYGRILKPLLRS